MRAKNSKLGKDAFTLVEMLVVIAVITVLAALILPTLSTAKQKAQGISCVNNSQQLFVALRMYADNFRDWLPPNPDWQTNNMWVKGEMENPDDATNAALLSESLLAPYSSGSIKIFKCPGDQSEHVRTYSMSQAVGTKPASVAAVNGPWLDGTRRHKANHPWRTYGRFADMMAPAPAQLWVFMDENQYTINDGAFAVSMTTPTEIIDWPGTYHNRSAGIVFGDGHAEIHRWEDSRTRVNTRLAPGTITQAPDNRDLSWLQERTSALAQ